MGPQWLCVLTLLLISMAVVKSDDSNTDSDSNSDSDGESSTLRFVNVIFRHGQRNPARIYPNNPFQIDAWPQNTLGWLTPNGADHIFSLGRYIRDRYDGFLDRKYYHDELKIWSSDVYRTIMSANVLLDALYRGRSRLQPIPVKTAGKEENDELIHESKHCARRDELLLSAFLTSEAAQEINLKYEEEFKLLQDVTGMDNVNFMWTAFLIVDCLICQEEQGFDVPSWYTGSVKAALLDVNDLTFKYWAEGDELKRLQGGSLLKLVTETMRTKQTSTSDEKFHLYSGHDTTVSSVLTAMDIFDDVRPGFASAILLELHETSPNEYAVQVLYKPDYKSEAKAVTHLIQGCSDDMCPFDTFVEGTKSGVPDDWEQECQNNVRRKKRDIRTKIVNICSTASVDGSFFTRGNFAHGDNSGIILYGAKQNCH